MRAAIILFLLASIGLAAEIKKPFPRHWGPPPRIQTMDIVPLPGGYGMGSSTLANWIKRNMERDQRHKDSVPKLKPFPPHWGPPPRIQTRDYRPLPGGYGMGSSTLARWIQQNLDRDARARASQPIYSNDFSKEKEGPPGEKFLVLSGEFAIKAVNGDKLLELPGAPLSSHGLLFGPTEATNIAVQARVLATSHKRRRPAFGVGLNGVDGYRLQLSAAKGKLELFKQDRVVASAPCAWQSGRWTWLYLEVRKAGDKLWRVRGNAWTDGQARPAEFLIQYDDSEEPYAGMASVWGQPFSGTPIQYDDLSVFRVP